MRYSQMRTFSSVGMRPARRSTTRPPRTVAKLPRATVSFVVLASVVIHGVSAAPVLRALDRRFGRRTPDPA